MPLRCCFCALESSELLLTGEARAASNHPPSRLKQSVIGWYLFFCSSQGVSQLWFPPCKTLVPYVDVKLRHIGLKPRNFACGAKKNRLATLAGKLERQKPNPWGETVRGGAFMPPKCTHSHALAIHNQNPPTESLTRGSHGLPISNHPSSQHSHMHPATL